MMNKIKINKYLSILLVVAFAAVNLSPALSSAEVTRTKLNGVEVNNDFAVGPGKTEVSVNPGETITKNISITNRVDEKVDFNLTVEDFVGSDDPSKSVVLLGEDKRSPYSLADLIEPEIDSFSLEFGERITIPVTIKIPEDAEPRGYYGAVLVANDPEEEIDPDTGEPVVQGKTRIISRVGSLFLVRVNGEVEESGQLQDFDLIEPVQSVYSSKPKGFEVTFKNDGTVHLVPYGEISVTNLLGKEVTRLPLDAYFVLPESTRSRQVFWSNDFFGIGRYEATLSMYRGYGSTDDLEGMAVTFWILPWKILLGVFVAVVVLITLIYYVASRFELKRKQ